MKRIRNPRSKLLLAATYSLTSCLIGPTLHAAHRSAPKNGLDIGVYCFKSALPFLGDRCVRVTRDRGSAATPARLAKPSLAPTTPPGDIK
jgi:hypothetical protein